MSHPLGAVFLLDEAHQGALIPLHMCWVHDGGTRGIAIWFIQARYEESPYGSLGRDNKNRQRVHGSFPSIQMFDP